MRVRPYAWCLLVDVAIAATLMLALSGCMPQTLKLEADHTSHLLAGWPLEPQHMAEDEITQVQGLFVWRRGIAYAEAGVGYNVKGRDGGGFVGPSFTATARAGIEIPLR